VFAVAAPHEGQSYVEVVVGVLSAISLLLLPVFVVIVVLSKRHKLQGSPTTILRNSFGATINMKVCAMHYLGFSLVGDTERATTSDFGVFKQQGSPSTYTISRKEQTLLRRSLGYFSVQTLWFWSNLATGLH